MQRRHALRDDQWDKIKDSLPGKQNNCGVTAKDNRLFIDAVMWIGKTGAPWRDLPESYGKWSSVHKRFRLGQERRVANDLQHACGKC